MLKRIVTVTLAVMLLMPGFASARVEKITINGETVASDVAPMLMDGWFMVPFSAVGRQVGADVLWDPEARSVQLYYRDKEIVVSIGETNARVNGQLRTMDVPATIIQGRTMVTSGFMADCIGATVDWDYHSTTILFLQKP